MPSSADIVSIMSFSLLNWTSSGSNRRKQANDLITDPAKVASLLQQIIDARINLQISLPGEKQTFNSTVFEVDRKNLVFNIDELMPRQGHEILVKQKKLSAKGQGQGPMIRFSTVLVKAGVSSGAQYYKLQFPKSIKYTERRGMFRAKLGPAKRLDVSCNFADESMMGYVYDVSGIGIAMILMDSPKINVDDSIDSCSLRLPDEGVLRFDLDVRHVRTLGNGRIHVGGKFKPLKSDKRKMIGKFVRAIERDSLAKRRKDS